MNDFGLSDCYISPALARLLDQRCDLFEAEWKAGRYPRLEDYLADAPGTSRSVLLGELLAVELAYRCRAGATPDPADYRKRFPGEEEQIRNALTQTRGPFCKQELVVPTLPGPVTAPLDAAAHSTDWPTIPNFEVLGELGRGGMGVVYKARHRSLRRLVALKMILAGPHADPQQRARFRNEAGILARLRHPHIVQIYEVGEHVGRPYLALEFVEGGTLGGRLAGTPLPATDAAWLLQSLAQAVQAAHDLGIVHRDLKPANVLLTGNGEQGTGKEKQANFPVPCSPFPVAKITDFGLAKEFLGEQGQTRTGAVLGTPSYMAPEQARGDSKHIGPAADIYALGAILYESLTGRPPFKGASAMDTMLQVLADEPVPLSRLQPRVPLDLETICLKCLHKQPHRRYQTAKALAEDLERFLGKRPILARPTRWPERVAKWARREPKAAALTAGIIAVTLAALTLVTWQWQQTRIERNNAISNAKEAARQKDRALSHFRLARAAVDNFYTKVSNSPEMLEKGSEDLRTSLLETAAEFYRKFTQEEGNDPEVRAERGRGLQRLGALYQMIARNPEAEQAHQQALAIFVGLVEKHPNDLQYQSDQAAGLNSLATLYRKLGRSDAAIQMIQQAQTIYQRLAAVQSQVADYRAGLASCQAHLGMLYRDTGRNQDAEQAEKQALTLFQGLTRAYPKNTEYWDRLAACCNDLSIVYYNSSRHPEALRASEQALAAFQKVAADRPRQSTPQSRLATAYLNLGVKYREVGRRREAEDAYRRALAILQDVVAKHPRVTAHRHRLAITYMNLGVLYSDLEQAKEAEESYQQALPIYRKLVEDDPQVAAYQTSLANACFNLGKLYLAAGRTQEAEEVYRQAQSVLDRLIAAHPDVPGFTIQLGELYTNLIKLLDTSGKFPEALDASDRAIAIVTPLYRKEPRHRLARHVLRDAHWGRALVLIKLGRHAESAREWAQVLKFDGGSNRTFLQVQVAIALARSGDHAGALAEVGKVEKEASLPPVTLYTLAVAYSQAAAAVSKDGRLTEPERGKLAARYAAQAMEFLNRARAAGLFKNPANVARLKKDPDLDPLRGCPDFKNLTADLEPPAKTGPQP